MPVTTTDENRGAAPPASGGRRLAWFLILYFASLAAFGLLALGLRSLIGFMG